MKLRIWIYFKIIEKMIVLDGNRIIITLLDGTEVEVVIELKDFKKQVGRCRVHIDWLI